jgi:hypothetical protein
MGGIAQMFEASLETVEQPRMSSFHIFNQLRAFFLSVRVVATGAELIGAFLRLEEID